MRARNVGEMCAGEMDDLQGDDDAEKRREEKRWEEACRREEAIRDLLSRNPDGLKGRDVTDLGRGKRSPLYFPKFTAAAAAGGARQLAQFGDCAPGEACSKPPLFRRAIPQDAAKGRFGIFRFSPQRAPDAT